MPGPLSMPGVTARLSAYEQGQLDDDDVVDLFQDLIDFGVIYHLQGSYQETAQRLVDAGLCHPPR